MLFGFIKNKPYFNVTIRNYPNGWGFSLMVLQKQLIFLYNLFLKFI